jgi:hypothetical protein
VGDTAAQSTPLVIAGLQGVRARSVAAGYHTSLTVMAGGEAYGWGRGVADDGMPRLVLGLELTETRACYARTTGCACMPERVQPLSCHRQATAVGQLRLSVRVTDASIEVSRGVPDRDPMFSVVSLSKLPGS